MQAIDVHDLPEPVAKAIAETVENLREQLKKKQANGQLKLHTKPLGVIGDLRREQIYDHLNARTS